MSKHRTEKLCIFIFVLFTLLVLRLTYIQLIEGRKLSSAAYMQRTVNTEAEKPRGEILDRNGIPLTHRTKTASVIIKPLYFRGKEDSLGKVCDVLELDFYKFVKEIEVKREPIIIETDESKISSLVGLRIEGVSVLHSLKRYDENTLAKHVLGYLSKTDQNGEAGIEKAYQEVLSYNKEKTFSVVTDARNNIIQGLGYRVNKADDRNKKLNIRLTIDYHIQKIVEEIMEKDKITGAVVVEDVYSGDILAMSSKPDYNPNDISKYLSSPKNELFNRAVASYNLGSIFKIIDAAYIIEKNKNYDEWYECKGFIRLGDKEFKCSAYENGGHGWINFEDAFAKSCNPYFINLGMDIGANGLLDMARKFGLGTETGIDEQGISEAAGNIPENADKLLAGDTANISIGQGNIMATPLQVANIIATVANGGVRNAPCIADSIVDSDGNLVNNIRRKEAERIISKETADRLKKLMEGVTSSGTGEKAQLESYGGSAGKTGSAETGQYINGEKVVHAWFAGYFPRVTPRYAIAVFIENGKAGSQSAAPVFSQIASEMAQKGF